MADALTREEEVFDDINDFVLAQQKARGPQRNISFLAFTATPRNVTLERFGRLGSDGKPHPFHLYSMRQAIEEHFILDVLQNYMTYKAYYRLEKTIEDDPAFVGRRAQSRVARFASLHPTAIDQKVEVIVEHFRRHVAKELDGQPPCPETGRGAVSDFDPEPCPENAPSRVRNPDSNLVREPVSKPVKEEEGACARDGLNEGFFGSLLSALGFDPDGPLPGWWQGWPPREHVRRWQTDLGLTAIEMIDAAEASRQEHPEPPDGPKALDRVMQRAAQCKMDAASRKRRKPKAAAAPEARPITDLPLFYAEMVNSDRYVPVSAISNSMRDVMLARGLVTAERLRERGIR